MKKICLLLIFILASIIAYAQQNYDVSRIPGELLPYAKAVIRTEEQTVEVKDFDNVIYHVKKAITILNKNGDDLAEIVLWHGKSYNIKYVKGIIYDGLGNALHKFSESAFEDVSDQDGFSFYLDSKVEYYRPAVTTYPYTIEYEYELRVKESINLDEWDPLPGTGIAVENTTYTFKCKSDFGLKYKEMNMPVTATVNTNDGIKTYNWSVSNLKAVKSEPYSPNNEKYLPMLKLSPVKFSYGGMYGIYNNWSELGRWIDINLLSDRQTIPAATIDQVRQMTAGISDPKLKAKKIYEYMQSKTHYVNVAVGPVAGFQPIPAMDVDKLDYGDCKALVNYTRTLLNAVDINSYYCIVMANSNRKISLLNDFPSMDQANHIILCLPFKNDTTWCDCTSQTIPFGYLGDFTDDRTVLAITPLGGELLHTPKYTAQNNLSQRKADFVLNNEGELSGNMITTFRGVDYMDREEMMFRSYTEQVKEIPGIYPVNNIEVKKLVYEQDKSMNPVTTEHLGLLAQEYASVDNGRITFLLNSVNRMYHAPKDVMNRKEDVYINEGYTEDDDISYTLPAGYRMESAPLNIAVKTIFGTFTATGTVKDGKLFYTRKLQVIDGTYPKDSYQDLVDFFQQVVDADATSVILQKTAN